MHANTQTLIHPDMLQPSTQLYLHDWEKEKIKKKVFQTEQSTHTQTNNTLTTDTTVLLAVVENPGLVHRVCAHATSILVTVRDGIVTA